MRDKKILVDTEEIEESKYIEEHMDEILNAIDEAEEYKKVHGEVLYDWEEVLERLVRKYDT